MGIQMNLYKRNKVNTDRKIFLTTTLKNQGQDQRKKEDLKKLQATEIVPITKTMKIRIETKIHTVTIQLKMCKRIKVNLERKIREGKSKGAVIRAAIELQNM